MELKEYFVMLKKHSRLFFITWLVVLVFPAGVAFWQGRHYESIFSLNVGFSGSDKTADYQYDQYYRLMAAEKFSDSLLWWLKDPETVRTVLEKAGVPESDKNWQNWENIFQGKRLSSVYSQVSFRDFTPRQAEKIADVWREVLNQKVAFLNGAENSAEPTFFVEIGKSLTGFPTNNYRLLFLIGFLVGFPLAVFAVLFFDYFRETDARRN